MNFNLLIKSQHSHIIVPCPKTYNDEMNLLERNPFIAELTTLLYQAASGQGHLVFLGGEAGVGKTALVQQLSQEVKATTRVAIGACDPLSTPRPLGPVLDVAQILNLETPETSREQMFQGWLTNLSKGSQPTLLVFEDLHWADEATLDLLRFLGRRIGATKTLLVATYRDDEVGAQHPLRVLLGDLTSVPAVRRMVLPALSEHAVLELARGSGLDGVVLYRQTRGNAFFVTESLAAQGQAVPNTVRDAVLARVSRLSVSSRAVLEAAALIGPRMETWLLNAVVGSEIHALQNCLDGGMLVVQADGFAFRHELARQAVLSTVAQHRQTVLHSLILEALRTSVTQDFARLAHHAEAANDRAAVLEFAIQAARRAAAFKAHREAAEQYARVLRFSNDHQSGDHALVLEAYSYECYLTDQLEAAVAARKQALNFWQSLPNFEKEGENLRWLSRLSWFLGRNADAERYAQAALEVLETDAKGPQLAMAYSNLSQLRMLNSDADQTIFWGEKAMSLAQQFGDTATLSHALNNIGTARLGIQSDLGWDQLEQSLRLALSANLEEHAARAWTNLVSQSVQYWQFERATRYLNEGIAYTSDHDLDSWRLYIQGWKAVWLVHQGRWSEAIDLIQNLTSHPQLSTVSRIQALVALGLVRLRRGDPEVWLALDQALACAVPTAELQRLGKVYIARVEAFWLEGKQEHAVREARAVYDLALEKQQPWLLGELAYWRWKLNDLDDIPADIARPFALQIAGQPLEAAKFWHELNCPYEAARAFCESDDENALKAALGIFEDLGARPMAQWLIRRLKDLGIKGIPRGARRTTKTNPGGLTSRELEVLRLLVVGQSDKQIAQQLQRSTKTVGHHVSAILVKLGSQNRLQATHKALKLGLLEPN